jgi:hypothetical protein
MSFSNLFHIPGYNRFCLFFCSLSLGLLGLGAGILYSKDLKERIVETITLEDFEENRITEENFIVRSNQTRTPEVKMSKNLVSPDLLSETSLLLRFPKGTTNLPIEIRFQNPILVNQYLLELHFHIFSNSPGGELGILIEDTYFEMHTFKIANLHFSDWKKIELPIGSKIYQADWILGKPSPVRIIGFLYTPIQTDSKNREDLIVIDDILAKVIPKLKTPSASP